MTTTDDLTRGEPDRSGGAYLSFLGLTGAIVVGLMALGQFPTRLAGNSRGNLRGTQGGLASVETVDQDVGTYILLSLILEGYILILYASSS